MQKLARACGFVKEAGFGSWMGKLLGRAPATAPVAPALRNTAWKSKTMQTAAAAAEPKVRPVMQASPLMKPRLPAMASAPVSPKATPQSLSVEQLAKRNQMRRLMRDSQIGG